MVTQKNHQLKATTVMNNVVVLKYPTIGVQLDNKLTMSKKMFLNLNNKKNKRQFVNRIADSFGSCWSDCKKSGNRCWLVVLCNCLHISAMTKPTNAITKDTDNLTLLLHYCQPAAQVLYMTSSQTTISINSIKLLVPQVIIKTLLFTHSRTGCDTTSRPKGTVNSWFCQKVPSYKKSLKSSCQREWARRRSLKEEKNLYSSSLDQMLKHKH